MGYRNLQECVQDLEKKGQLVRIDTEVDAHLEVGAIQRRVYQAQGPALLFTHVKNSKFPMLGNLFGTLERTRFLFRDTLAQVRALIDLKADPQTAFKRPSSLLKAIPAANHLRPTFKSSGPVLANSASISDLPQLVSWPQDGGAYITLPQVYTESTKTPGWKKSNLGMYRIQLSGNSYKRNEEIGLHYQFHRGIGVHHTEALEQGKPLRVNIFVGGAPAMTLAAVMPLPEGLPELSFAGALAGHRIPLVEKKGNLPLYAEADFCITGVVMPGKLLPEGPFGDHLGYYSLKHDFPFLRVESVTHRNGAIWPFTTVGRPPQEDTSFGDFIHELTGPLIPTVMPGVQGVHAVDAAGVHPLLLALGSERYAPYESSSRPQELLTQANAILGQGQLSLTKYLIIADKKDAPDLDIHDVSSFLTHALERIDFARDLHFQTETTIDTLDYSGSGLNEGSKVVLAVRGPKRRDLPHVFPKNVHLPEGFDDPRILMPGVLVIEGKKSIPVEKFTTHFSKDNPISHFPLIVVVDDSEFAAKSLNNFLWVTFTRSNPAADIYGIESFTKNKHWGCHGSLVIDARLKPHNAPPLEDDPAIEKRVDALGAVGGPLHQII